MVMQDHAALHTLEVLGSLVEEEALEALPEAMRMMILVVLMMMILLVLMAGTCSCIGAGAVSTRMGMETPPLPTSNCHDLCKNIATGETSQAITPFHFFDNSNFHH